MRNALCWILVLTQVYSSQAVAANDSIDVAIQSATVLRDTLESTFPGYVESFVKTTIETRFMQQQWDHLSARQILVDRSDQGMSRLASIENEFDQLTSKLFDPVGDSWDVNATRAFALIAEAQNLRTQALQIQSDARTIKESWLVQCQPRLRDGVAKLLDPLSFMELMEPGHTSAVPDNVEIGIQVSTNFDGENTEVKPKEQDGNMVDTIIINGSIGLIVYGGPIGVIVGIVILAIYAIVKIGMFTHALAEAAKKEGKLYDLQRQIRQIQLQVLESVSARVPGITKSACDSAFVPAEAERIYIDGFDEYLRRANALFTKMQSRKVEVLAAFKSRYEDLIRFYYPQVRENFVALADKRFEQRNKVEEQTSTVLNNIFRPLLARYQKAKPKGGIAASKAGQDVWSAMIQTDSMFRSDAGFSFLNLQVDDVANFKNSWNDIGPKITGALQ